MKKGLLVTICFCFSTLINAQQWKQVWSDEFNDTQLNTANWVVETGAGKWGNSELENYTSRQDNINVANGTLMIIGKAESYQGSNYTSGRIKTLGKQSWTYGKVEARIKMPIGKGIWPAFWMMGINIDTVSWPNCGEIDVMEHINSDSTIYGTMHWGVNNSHVSSGGKIVTSNVRKYHTYTVEWDSSNVTWFVDSIQYYKAKNTVTALHKPFFILLNMAIGGTWPGNPDKTTLFPDTMFVDYVRVYQIDTNTTKSPYVGMNNDISVFPNPATNSFSMNNEGSVGVELYTLNGMHVLKSKALKNGTISLKDVAKGIYFVKIIHGCGIVTKRLVVE